MLVAFTQFGQTDLFSFMKVQSLHMQLVLGKKGRVVERGLDFMTFKVIYRMSPKKLH